MAKGSETLVRQSILVVDSGTRLRRHYEKRFQRSRDLSLEFASNLEEARIKLGEKPDGLLVSSRLPDGDGMTLVREIRNTPTLRTMAIIVLASGAAPEEEIAALDGGADDFVRKPLGTAVLKARLSKVFRSTERWRQQATQLIDGLRYDPTAEEVLLDGRRLALAPKTLRLLQVLLEHPNTFHSREVVWERVWGARTPHWDQSLRQTLSILRHRLGPWADKHLESRHSLGYIVHV